MLIFKHMIDPSFSFSLQKISDFYDNEVFFLTNFPPSNPFLEEVKIVNSCGVRWSTLWTCFLDVALWGVSLLSVQEEGWKGGVRNWSAKNEVIEMKNEVIKMKCWRERDDLRVVKTTDKGSIGAALHRFKSKSGHNFFLGMVGEFLDVIIRLPRNV